jgi:hypothetical protein
MPLFRKDILCFGVWVFLNWGIVSSQKSLQYIVCLDEEKCVVEQVKSLPSDS